MIYIISLVMLMVCLISGAVLTAAGPNVKAIVDKDFARKSYQAAQLASLQYADICLRAKSVIPGQLSDPNDPDSLKELDLGWLAEKDAVNMTVEKSHIRVFIDATGDEMIDANITQIQEIRDLF